MSKTAKIIVILLILSNVISIGFLIMSKKKHPHPHSPKKIIIEKLNFDENQEQEFVNLIEVHRNEVKKTHQAIGRLKDELYKELKNENPVMNDSLFQEVTTTVMKLEKLNYEHFKDIKGLCTDSQLENFSHLIDQLGTLFQPKRPKNL